MGSNTWAFVCFLPWVSVTLIPWVKESLFPCLGCWISLAFPCWSTVALSLPWEADLCGPSQRLFCLLASSWIWLRGASKGDRREGGREERKIRAFLHCRMVLFIHEILTLLSGDPLHSFFFFKDQEPLLVSSFLWV